MQQSGDGCESITVSQSLTDGYDLGQSQIGAGHIDGHEHKVKQTDQQIHPGCCWSPVFDKPFLSGLIHTHIYSQGVVELGTVAVLLRLVTVV